MTLTIQSRTYTVHTESELLALLAWINGRAA